MIDGSQPAEQPDLNDRKDTTLRYNLPRYLNRSVHEFISGLRLDVRLQHSDNTHEEIFISHIQANSHLAEGEVLGAT